MLDGKRIIITGAAQGIGATMARGFAAMGARVVLTDIDNPDRAAEEVRAAGGEAISVQADVTKLDSATTVQGDSIEIAATMGQVKVDNATVVATDIEASNGVIHVIDSVILPNS